MKKLIYILLFILLLVGSNNYTEMNNLAIITNIAIEKSDNNYKVIFQEIIPKREENKINKDYKYYINVDSKLKNAFNKIDDDITKEIYLNHLENIIIKDSNSNIIDDLETIFKKDLDNFNIIYTDSDTMEILKYSNNYNYVNKIINDNTTFRSIKKDRLENKKYKIPVVNIKDNKLLFYKYRLVGGK